MKKKSINTIVIGIIIAISAFIVTFVFYKSLNNLTIYTSKDTYAYSYAKKNLINVKEVPDSDLDGLPSVLETFKYNLKNNGIEITKYEGISSELYIPETYENMKIVGIAEKALPDTVKTVVFRSTKIDINKDDFKNISIKCYKHDNCESWKNDGLNVTFLNDSDVTYDFFNPSLISYNIDNSEITIKYSFDESDITIIPKTINGYKVTKLDLDGSKFSGIYIPDTVQSISGNITSKIVNKFFILSVVLTIASLVVFIGVTIVDNKKDLSEVIYLLPKQIFSIVYLLIIVLLTYFIRNNPWYYRNYVVIAIIVTFVYMFLGLTLSNIKKKSVKYDEKIKKSGSFIKEAIRLIDDIDSDKYDSLKEDLKYSDPNSTDEVKKIEEEIKQAIVDKLPSGDIKKLLKKRNSIIKDNK